MILDSNLVFDPSGTAITVSAASTNVLDMGITGAIPTVQGRDIGIGYDQKLVIYGNNAFAAGGAATLNIQLQAAPDNGSGAPGTYVTLAETGALSIAQLNAGTPGDGGIGTKLFPIDVPPAQIALLAPRFYRLNYVVATGPFTAGTIVAYLAPWRSDMVTYPRNFSLAGA